jgi:Zn finger protein HypA/HybF involved in hydrogenase expression
MTELDRTLDGVARTCDECSRPFKGEAWQDWCAECAAEKEKNSPLHDRMACLNCNTTFELGRVRSGPQGWKCPNCASGNLSPAQGVREIEEYHGDIGTKN